MTKPKVLFIGPLPPPYTGQSIAFEVVVKNLSEDDRYVLNPFRLGQSNLGFFKEVYTLLKALILLRYDTVYFTCSRTKLGSIRDVIILFFVRIKGAIGINHLHGADFQTFYESLTKWHQWLIRKSFRVVTKSIVLSPNMIDQLSMFHEMEKCVVANSYHHKFDFKEIEKNWDSGMIEVIYHSNIMASKGILLLLAAFQKLLKNGHLKINLTITGDFISDYLMNSDDIKARFINKLTEIQEEYPENIHYIGPVDLNQKVEMLNKSHVFVLPTFHKGEAIPLTILEAMRSGLYIITTDHNYLPEIINKTNGELIKPNDLDSLYTSLEHLPSSTSLAEIGENNKVIASQIYSEKLFIDNVADVLNLNGNTCLQRDQ